MNPTNKETQFIEKLVPKSFHFDGYNAVGIPGNNLPLFQTQEIKMNDYYLYLYYDSEKRYIALNFKRICCHISFNTYYWYLTSFIEQVKDAVMCNCDTLMFKVPVSYHPYKPCDDCNYSNEHCQNILKQKPEYLIAAVTFDFQDMKEAISDYLEIKNQNTNTYYGGKTTMETRNNKLIGLNLEFGASKDPRIASTLNGVAVKNNSGDWLIFNSHKGTLTNYKSLKLGSFPVVLIPVKAPSVGDLLKINKEYYYVREVKHNALVLVGAADGIVQERVKEESLIPGLHFYTKVIALNTANLTDSANNDVSGNLLAAVLLTQWSSNDGGAKFSLDNFTNESLSGLGDLMPLLLTANNGILSNVLGGTGLANNIPLLLALGGDSNNETTQLLLLSQLLDGKQPLANIIPGVQSEASCEVVCTKCGKTYASADTKFCSACGSPTKSTAKTCAHCNATLKADAAFCHKCGTKVLEVTICPNCGKELNADDKFCPACGAPAGQDLTVSCKNCGRELNADEKFCPACGTPAGQEPVVHCKKCGKELNADDKFCTSCGTSSEKVPETPKKKAPPKKTPAKETTTPPPTAEEFTTDTEKSE